LRGRRTSRKDLLDLRVGYSTGTSYPFVDFVPQPTNASLPSFTLLKMDHNEHHRTTLCHTTTTPFTLVSVFTLEKFIFRITTFYADAAVLLAVMYACYICVVYYLQLTFVRAAVHADPLVHFVVEYKPGGPIFAVDILGYVLLSLSTIFLTWSLTEDGHFEDAARHVHRRRLLRRLLHLHGEMGLGSFAVPFLPMIYQEDTNEEDHNFIWQIPLLSWCVLFAPICFCMANFFQCQYEVQRIKKKQ
jgi:hypothetical protein